jgi:phosphoserine phosphatase RsbU/P
MKTRSANLLTDVPLFKALPADELARLQEILPTHEAPAKTWIIKEGQPGDHFFVILQGKVEIIKAAGSPEESRLGFRSAGDFIGEMGLLNQESARTASARTVNKSRFLVVPYAEVNDLLARHPTLAYELARVLSERMTSGQNKTIRSLRQKNTELQKAYDELKAAQAQIVEKEKLERELQVAREIQFSILPETLPTLPGYDFGALMVPARAVGGDFYGIFPLDENRMVLLLGDVTDKGVPAALFMAQTYALLRASSNPTDSPSQILARANSLLYSMNARGLFATLIYGILTRQTGELHYVRAGHEYPILVSPDGDAQLVECPGGLPLGIWDDPMLAENRLVIPPGGLLLFYSDGVTDCNDPQQQHFGEKKLRQVLQTFASNAPAQAICQKIFESLGDFQQGTPQFDDVTLLAVRNVQ